VDQGKTAIIFDESRRIDGGIRFNAAIEATGRATNFPVMRSDQSKNAA
jgi:hypothetical protein